MCLLFTSHNTLVRPLIEYGHTIIYPRYEKHNKLIEGEQRRASKIMAISTIPGIFRSNTLSQ